MANLTKVDSSMIYAVGYDRKTKTLEVVFNSGAVWAYEGVPQKVYKELMAAGSKGHFMREEIIGCYDEYPVSKRGRR